MSYKYFMDANVLSTSGVKAIVETSFFVNNCIVLDEIAYELMDTTIGEYMRRVAQPPDVNTLYKLQDIVDDLVSLGILQTDHGNGDALLIAAALSMSDGKGDQSEFSFMRDQPVIVTNEIMVDAYAKKKGLDAVSGTEFLKILTAANAAGLGSVS